MARSVSSRRVRTVLAALPLLALLIGLGIWQLQRLAWKEDMLARLHAGIEAPAKDYDDRPVDEFQHLKLEGRLQAEQPLFLYARTLNGVAGVHVFMALERFGAPLIVDRGFLPMPIDMKRATAPMLGDTVTGIVRRQASRHWYEPANDAVYNQWYWPDLPAMADALHLPRPLDFYLEATEPTATKGPEPTGQLIVDHISNNHLQYAITWFALAGVLVVIVGLTLRHQR